MKISKAVRSSGANGEWYARSSEPSKNGQKLSFTNQDEQDTLLTSNNNEVENGNNKN